MKLISVEELSTLRRGQKLEDRRDRRLVYKFKGVTLITWSRTGGTLFCLSFFLQLTPAKWLVRIGNGFGAVSSSVIIKILGEMALKAESHY